MRLTLHGLTSLLALKYQSARSVSYVQGEEAVLPPIQLPDHRLKKDTGQRFSYATVLTRSLLFIYEDLFV